MISWGSLCFFIVWIGMAYFLISVIYYKIKLHTIRLKMQNENLINRDMNINKITLKTILFWILPITNFRNLKDIEHNKVARRINYSILGFILLIMIFGAYFIVLQ